MSELDEGYEIDSPDADNMILDAVVGIMDPLRGDVKDAVATAQHAGVMVSFLSSENWRGAWVWARVVLFRAYLPN